MPVLELTPAGDATFARLRRAAVAFDRRLLSGVARDEVDELHGLLTRLVANVGASLDTVAPWTGLVDGAAGAPQPS